MSATDSLRNQLVRTLARQKAAVADTEQKIAALDELTKKGTK